MVPRPEIQGLKYFPFDTGFFRDKKVRLLRGEHDARGVEIYQRLLCKIYEDNGYYSLWNDSEDCALLADETGYSEEKIRLIVSSCLNRSLFDDTLFKLGNVLTSRSIQRRYFSAIRETKIKAASKGRYRNIYEDLCLLTEDDLAELNKPHVWLKVVQKHGYSGNNDSISGINNDKSTINPAKEMKEKEMKENENIVSMPNGIDHAGLRQRYEPDQQKIISDFFEILKHTRKSAKLADNVIIKIYHEWEKYPVQKVIYALHKYIHTPALQDKKEDYVLGIMRNATPAEIEKYKHGNTKVDKKIHTPNKKSRFVNYNQRENDYDELERMEREYLSGIITEGQ